MEIDPPKKSSNETDARGNVHRIARALLLAGTVAVALHADSRFTPASQAGAGTLPGSLRHVPIAATDTLVYRALAKDLQPLTPESAELRRVCLPRTRDQVAGTSEAEDFIARLAANGRTRFEGFGRYLHCLATQRPGRFCDTEERRGLLVQLDVYFALLANRRAIWRRQARHPAGASRVRHDAFARQSMKQMLSLAGEQVVSTLPAPPRPPPELLPALRQLFASGYFADEQTSGTLPPALAKHIGVIPAARSATVRSALCGGAPDDRG